MAVDGRAVERRLARRRYLGAERDRVEVEVGVVLEQQLDRRCIATAAGNVQWRVARRRALARVGAVQEQQLHGGGVRRLVT